MNEECRNKEQPISVSNTQEFESSETESEALEVIPGHEPESSLKHCRRFVAKNDRQAVRRQLDDIK